MTLGVIDTNNLKMFKEAKDRIIKKVFPIFHGAFVNFNIQSVDWARNAAYDGFNYYYNRTWVSGLTVEELEIVILHDVLHYVCGHPFELKATAQNPKSVQIYMLECDKHIEDLLEKLGYDPIIKPNVSEHHIWMKAHDVVSGNREGYPWLQHKVIYETDKAKCAELTYFYNIGTNNNSFYQVIMGLKTIPAFFAYNHKNELIRVTRRNKDVKELVDIYNLANKLADTPEDNL